MAGTPFGDDEKQRIRDLHRQGWSLNRIANDLHRSPSAVSKHAADLGLTFDRSHTEAAVKAHAIDAAARRANITDRLYRRAEFNLARLEAPTYAYTDRIATGIVTEILDHVPATDERNLTAAIGAALQSAAKLEAVDAGSGSDHALSEIGKIGAALAAAAEALSSDTGA